jgi:hypothetical protein
MLLGAVTPVCGLGAISLERFSRGIAIQCG